MNTVITVNTASTMKTSELIRNAVDAHLWNGVDDRCAVVGSAPYLCCALSTYSDGSLQARMVVALIEEELAQYRKENPTALPDDRNLPIGATLNWQWTGEDLQAFRFMYAEMLACYFESIGD